MPSTLVWWANIQLLYEAAEDTFGTRSWNIASGAIPSAVLTIWKTATITHFPFATYAEAAAFSQNTTGAEEPLALIRQFEYIDEPKPGEYRHVDTERMVEWPVEFLRRPRRSPSTIPDFLSPDAPANRLDILRGLAPPKEP